MTKKVRITIDIIDNDGLDPAGLVLMITHASELLRESLLSAGELEGGENLERIIRNGKFYISVKNEEV